MNQHSKHTNLPRQGFALLLALGILVIVSGLGTAYVTFMTIESEEVRLAIWDRQSETLADRALTMSTVQLSDSLGSPKAPNSFNYDSLTVYKVTSDSEQPLEPDDRYQGAATVTVADENAKLNINYASVRLLQAILGIDGATARKIRASLPRPGENPTAEQRWFLHVDELMTRGFLTREQFAQVPKDLLTVYSSPGLARPQSYINVNTAPPKLLAAVFAIEEDKARAIAEARPFDSPEDMFDAIGKDPATYNVAPPEKEGAMPTALALTSDTFRLRCEAKLVRLTGPEDEVVSRDRVEAVVQFNRDAKPRTISWRGVRGEEETTD